MVEKSAESGFFPIWLLLVSGTSTWEKELDVAGELESDTEFTSTSIHLLREEKDKPKLSGISVPVSQCVYYSCQSYQLSLLPNLT